MTIEQRLNDIEQIIRINKTAKKVTLIAVSKQQSLNKLTLAYRCGIRHFGENYLQEALEKIEQLKQLNITWHFIGHIQSNKTKTIAENFNWVHTIDRLKIATRLSEQRGDDKPALNCCIQVNLSQEDSKSGVHIDELPTLANAILQLPNLKLRGLMAIPAKTDCPEEQLAQFKLLTQSLTRINQTLPVDLDTISMGMSGDYQRALAAGSTMLRLGTALFGPRA